MEETYGTSLKICDPFLDIISVIMFDAFYKLKDILQSYS